MNAHSGHFSNSVRINRRPIVPDGMFLSLENWTGHQTCPIGQPVKCPCQDLFVCLKNEKSAIIYVKVGF